MKIEGNSGHKDRSSMSVGSLQKKRISWGPSKILEFYPAEKFNQSDHSLGSSLPSMVIEATQKRQIGGILKNSKIGYSLQSLKDTSKRQSHIIEFKKYEMPLADVSNDSSMDAGPHAKQFEITNDP